MVSANQAEPKRFCARTRTAAADHSPPGPHTAAL